MTTYYKVTLQLNELDVENVNRIAAHAGCDKANALHMSLRFCAQSMDFLKQGYMTTVRYENGYRRGCTATISPRHVAERYNNRNPNAQPVKVNILRDAETLRLLQTIKDGIGTQSDDTAFAFALEYSMTTINRIQSANNGKAAQIFFTKTNDPTKIGYLIKKHPFNISLGNSWRRATRKMMRGVKKLNPLPAKKLDIITLPPPAPPAQEQTSEVQKNTAPANEPLRTDLSEPVQAMKPLKLKKGNGGFQL